jgi:archaellum component FlaC
MSDDPEKLIPVYLRRLDANVTRMGEDIADLKGRMTSLEIGVAKLHSDFAGQSLRMERIESRLERIEKRLDLIPA